MQSPGRNGTVSLASKKSGKSQILPVHCGREGGRIGTDPTWKTGEATEEESRIFDPVMESDMVGSDGWN